MQSASSARLVLIPGLLCDARVFSAQASCYPQAVIINGFGRLRTLTAMAREVLAAAPAKMALLGHSMGARVALEVLRLAPERVERLALVSTGVHLPAPGEREKRHDLLDLGRAQGVEALVDRWLPPMIASDRLGEDTLVQPLRAMCVEAGVDAFAAQIEALLGRPDVASLLRAIDCPTLVAVGSEDRWSAPAQHREIADAIPGARLTVIDGAGHMLPVEAPGPFNAAIADWLSWPTRH